MDNTATTASSYKLPGRKDGEEYEKNNKATYSNVPSYAHLTIFKSAER